MIIIVCLASKVQHKARRESASEIGRSMVRRQQTNYERSSSNVSCDFNSSFECQILIKSNNKVLLTN